MSGQGAIFIRGAAGALIVAGLAVPVAFGMWHSLGASFGYFPAIGATRLSFEAWQGLVALPGLWRAAATGLFAGLLSTAISVMLAFAVLAVFHGRLRHGTFSRILTPLLAAPHAAIAIGMVFVIAPSGWIARMLAPLVGWAYPPDIPTVGDPWALALVLALVVKELPFVVLILLGSMTQIPVRQHMATGRSLGYGRAACWLWLVFPQLWPLIRLPVLVVLAFAISVVDMAMIIGPSNPPTLAVMVARLFADPNVDAILPASAGGVLQLVLVGVGFAALLGAQILVRQLGRLVLRCGLRLRWLDKVLSLPAALAVGVVLLAGLGLMSLLIWSVSFVWRWPDLWPASLSMRAWRGAAESWQGAAGTSLLVAVCSTAIALLVAIVWLESGDRTGRGGTSIWLQFAIYLPLLMPQISFLIGLGGMTLQSGLFSPLALVVWGHWLFVFPYVMIALADPWGALDPRLERTAAALGAGPWRRFVRVKLPALLTPICTAAAVGFSVSIAQYLPTLFLGGGRIVTLTTEAVALSSGSDRRVAAVHATLQAVLPLLVFVLMFAIPATLHRNRRALRGGFSK